MRRLCARTRIHEIAVDYLRTLPAFAVCQGGRHARGYAFQGIGALAFRYPGSGARTPRRSGRRFRNGVQTIATKGLAPESDPAGISMERSRRPAGWTNSDPGMEDRWTIGLGDPSDAGADLFLALLGRRPQRAVRPPSGRRVVQRVIVAVGADVPLSPFGNIVGHDNHRPAARRARLPDRIAYCHLTSPAFPI